MKASLIWIERLKVSDIFPHERLSNCEILSQVGGLLDLTFNAEGLSTSACTLEGLSKAWISSCIGNATQEHLFGMPIIVLTRTVDKEGGLPNSKIDCRPPWFI